jgi:bifunctional DNA-binding transcriptional regulator/antitoxin component of YhaV-PrlF toxin-antitoxin module
LLVTAARGRYSNLMRNTVIPDGRGRLLLPPDIREALGLDRKALEVGERREVTVELRPDGSVVLRDPAKVRAEAIKSLRGSARGKGGSVDELLAERRREAALEGEKEQRLGRGA